VTAYCKFSISIVFSSISSLRSSTVSSRHYLLFAYSKSISPILLYIYSFGIQGCGSLRSIAAAVHLQILRVCFFKVWCWDRCEDTPWLRIWAFIGRGIVGRSHWRSLRGRCWGASILVYIVLVYRLIKLLLSMSLIKEINHLMVTFLMFEVWMSRMTDLLDRLLTKLLSKLARPYSCCLFLATARFTKSWRDRIYYYLVVGSVGIIDLAS
jgi:hypothetical protein